MLNKIFLIGNLTDDVELKTTQSGVSLCRFGLAVSRSYNQDGERVTDFFDCTAWRGIAESIARYCKKGHKICVVGSVQLRKYEDNQGVKRTAVDIIVQDVEFLTPKANDETSQNKPTLKAMDDDDDIPF